MGKCHEWEWGSTHSTYKHAKYNATKGSGGMPPTRK